MWFGHSVFFARKRYNHPSMDNDINTLFRTVMENLTETQLGRLSTRMIEAHREKDAGFLREAAAILLPDDPASLTDTLLFLRLIKRCHPDRTAALRKEAETGFQNGDRTTLQALQGLLTAEKRVSRRSVTPAPSFHSDEEIWQSEADYTVREEDFDSGDYLETDEESWAEEEISFLSALREELLGNLDFTLSPADLRSLEGELDLSGRELTELNGLEYCTGLSVLNLAGNTLDRITELSALTHLRELYLEDNDISDLSPLAGLEGLEILDLSGNDIDDISPLVKLPGLKFVDIRRNPLRQHLPVIRELERREVTVLY